MIRFFLFFALLLITASCDEDAGWDCLKSYGDDVTEIRFLEPFQGIEIEDNLRITYHADSLYRVEVRFGDHIIDKVETQVRDGILYLSNTARCNWVRNLKQKPEIAVYAPTLLAITNYGAGIFACADTIRTDIFFYNQWDTNGKVSLLLACEEVNIWAHQGFVDLDAVGRCTIASLYSKADGSFNAQLLRAETVLVRNETFQDLYCSASSAIYGQIVRSGNVRFGGNPSIIEVSSQGSGTTIPL